MSNESLLIGLMVIAVLVAASARRFRIPYTIAMVLTGLGVSFLNLAPKLGQYELSPHLILVTFLPGLLFEAGYHLELAELRRNLRTILILAVPGVLISMAIIGFLLNQFLDLPLVEALLFGVLISATDPIAVTSLFKESGVDKRLGIIVEGESLFNDGAAIVLFSILVGVATGEQSFSLADGIVTFFVTVAGGAVLGLIVGMLGSEVMKRTNDYLLDIAVTAIIAYGTYLLAEEVFHGSISPVIAVVVAAVFVGNYGSSGAYSASSHNTIIIMWEFVVFLINSAIFLLIGIEISPASLAEYAVPLLISIAVILLARALVVYPLRFIVNHYIRKMPMKWSHVLFWGGLRGAVSVALVLSLPNSLASRDLMEVLAFGYVLFSLLIQGFTISRLLNWLGLSKLNDLEREYEERRARIAMAHSALHTLDDLHNENMLSGPVCDHLRKTYTEQIAYQRQKLEKLLAADPSLVESNVRYAQREISNQQKQSIQQLVRRGILSQEIYDEMARRIDEYIAQVEDDEWHPRSVLMHGSDAYLPETLDTEGGSDTLI